MAHVLEAIIGAKLKSTPPSFPLYSHLTPVYFLGGIATARTFSAAESKRLAKDRRKLSKSLGSGILLD